MAKRPLGSTTIRLLIVGVLVTFFVAIFSGFLPLNTDSRFCKCLGSESNVNGATALQDVKPNFGKQHGLCVLVPFRDRFEELLDFAPYLHRYLTNQGIQHTIIIINQLDRYRFNRASLINAGFLESRTKCDYIAMHDVDLLPQNDELRYDFPEKGPYHLAAPYLHPLYHYKTYVGGILLVQSKHFEMLNGLSNKYWGWGKEDDEFFVRMRKAKLKLERPANLSTGYQSFRHIHDRRKRPRDSKKFFDQYEQTRRLDRITGVSTVQYAVDSKKHILIEDAPVTVLNIYLECNFTFTPWCLKAEDHESYLKKSDLLKHEGSSQPSKLQIQSKPNSQNMN